MDKCISNVVYRKYRSGKLFPRQLTVTQSSTKRLGHDSLDEIPSQRLFTLNSLKKRLEIASTETGEVVALNNLNEDSWSVHEMLLMILLALSIQSFLVGQCVKHTFVKSCNK